MTALRCPACDVALDEGLWQGAAAHLCASCGGAFITGPMTPLRNPWPRWNGLLHLTAMGALAVGVSWWSVSSTFETYALGQPDRAVMGALVLALAYAMVTGAVIFAARRVRLVAPGVHAAMVLLAWVPTWLPAQLEMARAHYRELTRAEPVVVPRVITLSSWQLDGVRQATLHFKAVAPGAVRLERFAWSRGEGNVELLPQRNAPTLERTYDALGLPLRVREPGAPEEDRLVVLVYPPVRERPCSLGPHGEPQGEAPTDRVIFERGVRTPRHLGPQPHECGPVDTWEYPLMDPDPGR